MIFTNSISSSAEEDGLMLNFSDVLKQRHKPNYPHSATWLHIVTFSDMMVGDWIAGQEELKFPRHRSFVEETQGDRALAK